MRGRPGRTPRERALPILSGVALVALTALLAETAYQLIFSTFDTPDDEGYLIVTLRSFTDGNALYDSVYSQYGPGFYTLVGGAMKIFGIAFTSDGARWVNLALWLASTLLAGFVLLRLTRNLLISAVGLGIAFLVLVSDASEPLHPGATIGFVLLGLVACAAYYYPDRMSLALALIGGLAVLLVSIKVNVGGLALISIVFACAMTSATVGRNTLLRALACALFVVVPFALMAPKLGNENTLRLAATVSGSALALVLATLRGPLETRPTWHDLRWLATGALAVLAAVCLVPIVLGTSPAGLIDGWLIRPLGHAEAAFNVIVLSDVGLAWVAAGLVGATVWMLRAADDTPHSGPLLAALGGLRLAVGIGIWITLASAVLGSPANLPRAIAFATPLTWIVAIGTPAEPPGRRFVRVLIAALAVLQTLHAYPVPGAQLAWGTLLFVIVGGVCVADGLATMAPAGATRGRWATAWTMVASAGVLVFGAWFAVDRLRPLRDQARATYAASVPLGLAGAERQRVDLPRAENLRALTAGIERDCDSFLTLPGLASLYLYTGQTPPEEMSSSWMLYLRDDEQQEIIDRVADDPGLCAVVKPDLLDFWRVYAPMAQIPDRPLVRFIDDQFRVLHDYSGYYLEARR